MDLYIEKSLNEKGYKCFDIIDKDINDNEPNILLSVPSYMVKYESIVNSIITKKYPSDKMQAVINNYLLDPSNEEAIAEFNEMQEFRAYAKEVAKEALAYIEENNL